MKGLPFVVWDLVACLDEGGSAPIQMLYEDVLLLVVAVFVEWKVILLSELLLQLVLPPAGLIMALKTH